LNYFKIYEQLVEKAKNRDESTLQYIERHHVVPRCMGGNDDKDNLVALTLEEHFVAHQLLTKMFPDVDALAYAANMMGNRSNKQYGWLKRQFVEREKAAKTGKPRTPESIAKQSATMKAKFAAGAVHPRKGKILTEEHKRQVSEGNKGKIIPIEARSSLEGYVARYGNEEGLRLYTENNKAKSSMSLQGFIARFGETDGPIKYEESLEKKRARKGEAHAFYGKTHSEETLAKMRGVPKPKATCPHCGVEGGAGIMKRWHFDNCKKAQ